MIFVYCKTVSEYVHQTNILQKLRAVTSLCKSRQTILDPGHGRGATNKEKTMPMLIITGQIKGKASGLIDLYVYNLCKELGINRMHRKLIELNFVTDLDGLIGDAWVDEKEGFAQINIARKCEDEKLDYADMMETLAHEMVHVKQFFRKELDVSSANSVWKWKGRNAGGYKYENQPWELEAYRRQADLYQKCWPL
tara:strand:+ start:3890 stop:4474 length:585 start_codon:yes stop_codon:yes gene_type:complete